MSARINRHPRRTWFGDTPVRTLADKEREENSRVGADHTGKKQGVSAVDGNVGSARVGIDSLSWSPFSITAENAVREQAAPAVRTAAPALDPLTAAAADCQQQARYLFADRLLQPEEIRAKYPAGWLRAPYVVVPRLWAAVRA